MTQQTRQMTLTGLLPESTSNGHGSTPTPITPSMDDGKTNVSAISEHMNARAMPSEENPSLIPMNRNPKYITSTEIAWMLGNKRETVSTNAPQGRYPFKPVARSRNVCYYDRAEVERWIDRGAVDKRGHYRVKPKRRV